MIFCEQPGCERLATTQPPYGPGTGRAWCSEHAPGYPPPIQPLPVSGFVLAMLVPIAGIFICRQQMLQAQRTGRDNQLARAGFYISIVHLAVAAFGVFIWIIWIVALVAMVRS